MKHFSKFLTELVTKLEYHDVLNPALWNGDTLKPEVRQALLKIAEAWRNFTNIPEDKVYDVIITRW